MAVVGLATSCDRGAETKPAPVSVQRFAAVGPVAAPSAASRFCELTYPATGAGARRFTAGPTRPLPGGSERQAASVAGVWRWVNVWATWCKPCLA